MRGFDGRCSPTITWGDDCWQNDGLANGPKFSKIAKFGCEIL